MTIQTSIGWTDKTWNYVTGCWGPGGTPEKPNRCFNGHCYAQKMANRLKGRYGYPKDDPFKPTYHISKWHQPYFWHKPCRIFVCSMGDLFGDWVLSHEIHAHIAVARMINRHKYIFLTKNPKRYLSFYFPDNCWLGTTVTEQSEWKRLAYLKKKQLGGNKIFVSFEPLLGDVNGNCIWKYAKFCSMIIVGRMTMCKKDEYVPQREWIERIMEQAQLYGIPIYLKDNLIPIIDEEVVRSNQCEW